MDNSDLSMALASAMGTQNKITFFVKENMSSPAIVPVQVPQQVEADEEMINTESKKVEKLASEEEPLLGRKGKRGGQRGDHMNRKALKTLI